jgi:multisubunit Na+/H+ antiporter MnhG subunit
LGLVSYDGIYVTASATRFTIFAVSSPPNFWTRANSQGAFGTASIGYILIASMLAFMERDWHTWFILVLDIFNWIFFLVSWASLAAAISTTTNALMFCKNNQIQNIIDSTPNLAGDLVTYLRGLQQACNMTYAGMAFGIVAWY